MAGLGAAGMTGVAFGMAIPRQLAVTGLGLTGFPLGLANTGFRPVFR